MLEPQLKTNCCLCAALALLATPLAAQRSGDIVAGSFETGVELGGASFSRLLPAGEWSNFGARMIGDPLGGLLLEAATWSDLTALGARSLLRVSFDHLEERRFYGYGNATDAPLHSDFYKYRPTRLSVEAALDWPIGEIGSFRIGPSVSLFSTNVTTEFPDADDEDEAPGSFEPGEILSALKPYGSDLWASSALAASVELQEGRPYEGDDRGFRMAAEGRWTPRALSAESSYGRFRGETAAFWRLGIPGDPIFAARFGADFVFGEPAFQDAAYLGGRSTLRGFRRQRYAGDAALWSGAELRFDGGSASLRGRSYDFGPVLFADMGRVYRDGTVSGGWHAGFGGGMWFRPTDGGPTVTATLAHGNEFRAYLGVGLFTWR